MNKPAILALALFAALIASGQSVQRAPRKVPGMEKPECSPGAICFSGEVSQGGEFRKALNTELEFVLQPGWEIAILPKQPEGDCREFASVVNGPYRTHRDLLIDTSYVDGGAGGHHFAARISFRHELHRLPDRI
jgi:hypothetical protein